MHSESKKRASGEALFLYYSTYLSFNQIVFSANCVLADRSDCNNIKAEERQCAVRSKRADNSRYNHCITEKSTKGGNGK